MTGMVVRAVSMWLMPIVALVIAGSACDIADRDLQAPTDVNTSRSVPMPPELFAFVSAPPLSATQSALLAKIKGRAATAEVRIARLSANPAALLQQSREIVLNLTPSDYVVARGESLSHLESGDVYWAGPLRDRRGSAALVITSKGVTGTIESGSVIYEFEPLGGDLHAITRLDPSKAPSLNPLDFDTIFAADTEDTMLANAAKTRGQSTPSSSFLTASVSTSLTNFREVGVMVVYTAAAAAAVGDVNGTIQLAIQQANTSFSNSQVSTVLYLAHAAQVNYNEGGNHFATHLALLQGTSDGVMDEVHSLRNQHLADVVVLLVNHPFPEGLAGAINATPSTAFTVVGHQSAASAPHFVMAHEIGHLLGACHDRGTVALRHPNHPCPVQYAHGYVDPNRQWRTIMAYPDQCSQCSAVPYWSNPYVTHPTTSQSMGTITYEHNARELIRNNKKVRNFRTLPSPHILTLGNGDSTGVNPYFTWNTVTGADFYHLYRCEPAIWGCTLASTERVTGYSPNPPFDLYDNRYHLSGEAWPPCSYEEATYYVTAEGITGESAPGGHLYSVCVRALY